MSKLVNFFFSFDKLMKEGLVRAFFWLGLLNLALKFFAESLDAIQLDWFAAVFEFVNFFAGFLLAIVALRLIAELAIALFRINDNLSPDGGKSETANIDPVAEARKAAEMAAKRASEVTKSATERGKAVAHDLKEDFDTKVHPKTKAVTPKVSAPKAVSKVVSKKTAIKKAAKPVKKVTKKVVAKKPVAKKVKAAKTAVKKKVVTKKASAKKTGAKLTRKPGMKLDGTPRKRPGPKK